MKPNNQIYQVCSEESFYRLWMTFLTPFHKLTPRERDVAARIISQYFKLKDKVEDPEVLHDILWSHKCRNDMRESLKMSPAHFQMVLAKLRENGVLEKDDKLNPKYIPHKTSEKIFNLSVVFDWRTEEEKRADLERIRKEREAQK